MVLSSQWDDDERSKETQLTRAMPALFERAKQAAASTSASILAAPVSTKSTLTERWMRLLSKWHPADQVVHRWWRSVRDSYASDTRCYHSLQHLRAMFRYYDKFVGALQRPELVQLAIFFHDVVYDATKVTSFCIIHHYIALLQELN